MRFGSIDPSGQAFQGPIDRSAGFFKERLDEAIERIEEKIANELKILSPCLTSSLFLEIIEDDTLSRAREFR